MRHHFKSAALRVGYALAGFVVGGIAVSTGTKSGNSMVLTVVKRHEEASTGPFFCTLGEHGSVKRYLSRIGVQTDRFDDIRTIDDRNMLVVFDGRELTAVEFTTFGHRLPEEKCSRID